MSERACPIWGTKAKFEEPRYFDGEDICSTRAGGRFRIDDLALAHLDQLKSNDAARAKLSLLISNSQSLSKPLLVTSKIIAEVMDWPATRPFEKAERLLRFIARNTPTLNFAGLRWDSRIDERESALAATELLNTGEIETVLEYLVRKGFCETKIDSAIGTGFVWLTLEGAEHVEAANVGGNSDQAFVAMWFSPETLAAYEQGIAPAIQDNGYQPVRIDLIEHNNKIDDEIISKIRRARFVVADFTCGIMHMDGAAVGIARGGVYFEAGFAMGLGVPVIWTVREDLIGHVHFDTRQFNHILWKSPGELRINLRNRIGAVIGQF